jgi:peroxiredoxin
VKRGRFAPGGARWFWVLVALSAVTLGLCVWWVLAERAEQLERFAIESRPAAEGPSKSHAPDFTLATADGGELSLGDLRRQVVLLNFWATWCPPCKEETPDLNALYETYGAEHDFTVIGVNLEESADLVQAFAAEYGVTFPLLLDRDGAVTNGLFAVRGLPMSLIIDREGMIRDVWQGRIAREAMLARLQRVW